ncbi:MAG TPA: ATP12 family protein [Allosphingosinicella sp.]|nr:ATP12 family protein [Allosphingosinicella sp.]
MKRFYKEAAVAAGEIRLDGRPVRTPGRRPLALPTPALAEAVAAEWAAQGDKVEPRAMPLTGLANAAIDRVATDREAFARGLAAYAETDLLCYRAEGPPRLAERQSASWDPLLAWARRRYDVDFELVRGVIHRPQPSATVARLAHAVHARGPFELAGLSPLVTISGSLVTALALAEGAVALDEAWTAAMLDELWQAEQWGEDAEAVQALAARRADFEAAFRFLSLL